MLAQRDRGRRQLADLVPLHGGRVDPLVGGEDVRAGPAALRPVLDNLVHPLERKQRPVLAFMPGLAAPLATGAWPAGPRRRRRRILRRRQRRVARTALEPPLELSDSRLEPPIRLDKLSDPHQQRDRRLPITIEDRLRLRPLHPTQLRRDTTGPCTGAERLPVLLPVEAQTTAGFFVIPRTSRKGIAARPRPEPVIHATRTTGRYDRRSSCNRLDRACPQAVPVGKCASWPLRG